MRFAIPILVVAVTALLVLGSPFLRVRFGVPGADVLPPEAPTRVGLELLEQEFNRGALPSNGLEIQVGGEVAILMDFVDAVFLTFPWAIALILGISYVVLYFLFESISLPLKAVLMNALSITAAYGALVFVFQDGDLSGQLGFEPCGFVDATLPVLLFCMLFRLSMDYELFLLSRVRESWERTRDNT